MLWCLSRRRRAIELETDHRITKFQVYTKTCVPTASCASRNDGETSSIKRSTLAFDMMKDREGNARRRRFAPGFERLKRKIFEESGKSQKIPENSSIVHRKPSENQVEVKKKIIAKKLLKKSPLAARQYHTLGPEPAGEPAKVPGRFSRLRS